MNAYYCRKQFLHNPVEYVPIEIIPKIVPEEYLLMIESLGIYKHEIGKISAMVVMRMFKINLNKAQEIMKFL